MQIAGLLKEEYNDCVNSWMYQELKLNGNEHYYSHIFTQPSLGEFVALERGCFFIRPCYLHTPTLRRISGSSMARAATCTRVLTASLYPRLSTVY